MKIDEMINEILNILKRTLDIGLDGYNPHRITDNENDEMRKFRVKLKNGSETDDVKNFLDDNKLSEMQCHVDFNKLIWVDEYINSRERGLFDHDYYYPTEHIKEMNDLLNDDKEKNIFVKKNIFLLDMKVKNIFMAKYIDNIFVIHKIHFLTPNSPKIIFVKNSVF